MARRTKQRRISVEVDDRSVDRVAKEDIYNFPTRRKDTRTSSYNYDVAFSDDYRRDDRQKEHRPSRRVSVRKRRKFEKWFQDPTVWNQINRALSEGVIPVLAKKRRTKCENNKAARRAAFFRSGKSGIKKYRKHRC